ncbi:hypothetical protein LJC74_10185 [Eubacteriales bacterium OttesenSCG-928-A19]|nr:hypothetical protein [Eubacteriales bacterium OttesenSCG-928-A19]
MVKRRRCGAMRRMLAALVALACLAGAACAEAPALTRREYAAHGFAVDVPQGWQAQDATAQAGVGDMFAPMATVVADVLLSPDETAAVLLFVLDMAGLSQAERAEAMEALRESSFGFTVEDAYGRQLQLPVLRLHVEGQGNVAMIFGTDRIVALIASPTTGETLLDSMLASFDVLDSGAFPTATPEPATPEPATPRPTPDRDAVAPPMA